MFYKYFNANRYLKIKQKRKLRREDLKKNKARIT